MVRVVTCCPQADLKFWNLSTFPLLNAYSVSINHCLSVFLRDSKTGCISCRQMHCQGHSVLYQVRTACNSYVALRPLTSSPKLYTPSPKSPARPNVKALSCCSASVVIQTNDNEQWSHVPSIPFHSEVITVVTMTYVYSLWFKWKVIDV